MTHIYPHCQHADEINSSRDAPPTFRPPRWMFRKKCLQTKYRFVAELGFASCCCCKTQGQMESAVSYRHEKLKGKTMNAPTVFRSISQDDESVSVASCWWPANLDFCSKDEKLFPARCLPWFPPSATTAALIGIMTPNELNLLFQAEELVFLRTSLSYSHAIPGGGPERIFLCQKRCMLITFPRVDNPAFFPALINRPCCVPAAILLKLRHLLAKGFPTVIRLVGELLPLLQSESLTSNEANKAPVAELPLQSVAK